MGSTVADAVPDRQGVCTESAELCARRFAHLLICRPDRRDVVVVAPKRVRASPAARVGGLGLFSSHHGRGHKRKQVAHLNG
jgi:hypothetical protein